jgi:hypothetical protein
MSQRTNTMGDEPTAGGGAERDLRRATPPLDRRRFLALAGAAAATGTAGCGNDGEGTATPLTPPTDDDVVTVMTSGLPRAFDFGPSLDQPAGLGHLEGFLQSLVLPADLPTGEYCTSGHTWTVGGRETSVPCAVEDFELDGTTVELTFDDRLTYWNGDSLDGRAYYLRDRVVWLGNGDALDGDPFGHELVDATTYRRALDDEATNRFDARRAVHPGIPPMPPSFNERWVERFERASTEEALVDRFLDYIQGIVHLEEFVEEGYGSGAYEVESPGDVRREAVDVGGPTANRVAVYASPRPDHPGEPGIDRLRILTNVGTGSIVNSRVNGGAAWSPVVVPGSAASSGGVRGAVASKETMIDSDTGGFGTGVVGPHADIEPSNVPGSVEQVATYPEPLRRGRGLVFDWGNDHLRRLWVRRALVAALPLEGAVRRTSDRSLRAPARQTGLLSGTDRAVFDEAFLDELYEYPLAADRETAARWLRAAGYERPDDQWVGPGGEPLGFRILAAGQWDLNAARILSDGLESFGIATAVDSVGRPFYQERVFTREFDLALTTFPGGWSPSRVYGDWYDDEGRWRSASPVTVFGNPLPPCREGGPASSPDAVTLPADSTGAPGDPGPLRIEGVDYPGGGSTYRWPDAGGVERSVCRAAARLRERDVDRETYSEAAEVCARWYNYAVPNFVFAQDAVGLWADTGRLVVPRSDHPAMGLSRAGPVAPEHYHVQAGTVRFAGDGQ